MDHSKPLRSLPLALAWSALVSIAATPAWAAGLVVIETVPTGAAADAGLVAGHVLHAWERRDPVTDEVLASGELHSALDLWQVEVEERPRGGVRVQVERPEATGPNVSWIELAVADWGLEAKSVEGGELPHGDCAGGAAVTPPEAADLALLTAARAEAAHRAVSLDKDENAECFWKAALSAAESLPTEVRAHLEERFGKFLMDRDRFEDALARHEAALRLRQAATPASLAVAASLDQIGIAAWYIGDRERVLTLWQEALAIRETVVPDSLLVAKSLNNLSLVSPSGERLALLRRALAIRETLDPDSSTTANLLTNLGQYHRRDGDLDAAEPYLTRAEAILRRLAPDRRLAVVQLALGSYEKQRGRFAESEARYRDAVSLLERIAPESFDMADAWLQLGDLLLTRWDSERGEVYLRRALDLFRRIAPENPQVVPILLNLGLAAKHRGNPDAARARYEEAVEVGRGGDADGLRSVNVAIALNNLGTLAQDLGDLDEAERRYSQARDVFTRVEPNGVDAARTLMNLGQIRLLRDDLPGAERLLAEALRIQDRLAPGSGEQARSLATMAQIAQRRGDFGSAEERFHLALEAIDTGRFLAAGSDLARARSNEVTADIVHAFAAFLIESGRETEAFALTERASARSFRTMLARRDLRFGGQLPAELEAERRRLQTAYDRTLLELGSWNSDQDPTALRVELEALRESQRVLMSEMSQAAPELSTLTEPHDSGIVAARAALPKGIVVLSYLVGVEESFLFIVTAADVRAVRIPFEAEALRRDVDGLLQAIERRETLHRPRYRRAAERLSARLLAPAAEPLASADAVIVVPHGFLHRLPFAALIDPADPERYWVQAVPLTIAPSLVALAELTARPRSKVPTRVAAFSVSDPRGRSSGADLDAVRGNVRARLDLTPLAHARREVETLGRIFGDGVSTYFDREATEEKVKDLGSSTSLVHFATHAWVDDRFPLESGLVLSIPESIEPGQDNGVLQAWEVIEQIRLDADLVTLSGCRTGLGRAFSGEGILGLTRAFHFAGARAVLASLWQVSDASTSTLMGRFYHHLREGLSLGAALRAAQLDLVTSESSGDLEKGRPYHWAGFQLFGDGNSTWKTKH
ncbi:MAG: CHAT domain-containing protein [Thermoanaerobaculia bacterium]|nr:CHAT domain-containing protein [Thermoanaerobaculia bacterium]